MLQHYQGGHPAYPTARYVAHPIGDSPGSTLSVPSGGPEIRKSRAQSTAEGPYGMTDVNSSGQGQSPAHVENAHHGIITGHGYQYSHSTVIHKPDGSTYLNHSYHHPQFKNEVVGVSVKGNNHEYNVHTLGSGHQYTGNNSVDLSKLLRGRLARVAKKEAK